MTALLHRWMPGVTLLAWGGVLLGSYFAGRFTALHPSFRPFTLAAGVALLALAGLMLLHSSARSACETGEHTQPLTKFSLGRWLTFFILVVPILAAAWSSPEGFGAGAIRNRGIVTDAAALPATAASALPAAAAGDTGPASGDWEQYIPKTADGAAYSLQVVDLLFAADDPSLRQTLTGKTVEIIGQLMPEDVKNVTGNRFRLVRMFMTCCAADARPIAVAVEGRNKTNSAEMSWIKVRGQAAFTVEDGKPTAVLEATTISPSSPPEETMLF